MITKDETEAGMLSLLIVKHISKLPVNSPLTTDTAPGYKDLHISYIFHISNLFIHEKTLQRNKINLSNNKNLITW